MHAPHNTCCTPLSKLGYDIRATFDPTEAQIVTFEPQTVNLYASFQTMPEIARSGPRCCLWDVNSTDSKNVWLKRGATTSFSLALTDAVDSDGALLPSTQS